MIRYFSDSDFLTVINIWQDAFLDNADWISSYLREYKQNVLVYEEDKKIIAMVSILPILLNNKKGRYIYALAVDKNNRNKGIGKKLVEYVKNNIKEDFLALVPQEESLIKYYNNLGFFESENKNEFSFLKKENPEVFFELLNCKKFMYFSLK